MLDRTAALSPLEAYQALLRFARQRGENALRLALHAAVPQSFRVELLHLLRLNFLPEAANDPAVEADVLLASFCEDIGGGYFQFDPEVRQLLLENLDPSYAGGTDSELQRVARFLLYFIDQQAHSLKHGQNRLTQDYLEVQRWVALAFWDPAAAAEQLADESAKSICAGRRSSAGAGEWSGVHAGRATGWLSTVAGLSGGFRGAGNRALAARPRSAGAVAR